MVISVKFCDSAPTDTWVMTTVNKDTQKVFFDLCAKRPLIVPSMIDLTMTSPMIGRAGMAVNQKLTMGLSRAVINPHRQPNFSPATNEKK